MSGDKRNCWWDACLVVCCVGAFEILTCLHCFDAIIICWLLFAYESFAPPIHYQTFVSPTIHVNVRTIRTKEDRQAEAARMWREHQAEEAAATTSGENELHGQTVYDLSPVTTMEYDVVACESFVEEKGAWVKNMPEEIRKANPNFVPS